MDNLSNIGVIKDVMQRHGFTFSKALGQNFLVNPSVCPRIAEMGNAKAGFGVIEIGTGVGVLTNELAKRADKVVAIEIDDRLIPVLEETLAEHDNVKVINADVMEVDLHKLIDEEFQGLEVAVCANLPYYITSPILMMLLEQRLRIRSVTVMVQKEAGVRLCAPVGSRDMGAVTVAVNYFSKPKILFNVSRGSFMPAPNVDSCVVRFDINDKTPDGVTDEKFFFSMVKAAFSQRRKTLVNSVSSGLGADKAVVGRAVEQSGLAATVRPEQLKMEELIKFSEELKKLL
ncbi:16S rRNA (adenine(1518)-N(6)/adenine(1519)-N(6))-dimethyltransferase RsmA [Ruminococcus sp.]|uniref:16S rRNA (adenine(1518)-N(6)/adenine(1519)-N(6))- dimethyltransferase RsmA n=1 Tax=Ruminococcus sp. TaxID=41978 RepID=UPI0025F75738|nr:16S rRNA (adenine(1518)-N(6)/adenine(1519)-N(6))-dimethyltransferase RsmA [Ruminococcus sp.]MBQ8966525.1 16S rRNA (adenine(1518)-N(6)/adenine(1519)-N(6))-dimethyltransferase RsmA [Ruminococcus sp.]